MKIDLTPEAFFELSDFIHREIFSGCQFVWEAVPKIEDYIANLFEKGLLEPNCEDNIYLGEGTVVEPGAYIKGPAVIGRNCHIGHVAYLRENILMGDACTIGHGVEVKNSIFLHGSTAAHLSYIGDSIVGRDVNIAAGTILANFRLDGEEIRIRVEDKSYDSKLLKLGAIVGDKSKIGVNCVLNPGTILGKKCLVHPLISAKGYHPEGSVVR